MQQRSILAIAAAVTIALVAGCGEGPGSSAQTTPGETATTPPAASDSAAAPDTDTTASAPSASGGGLKVAMTEFKFDPSDLNAKAGKVKVVATNDGKTPHELVLLKTGADPAKLPEKGGEVDEASSVGEIAEVPAGATGSHEFDLKPGKYVMICNLPGHYDAGMHGTLTVK